MNQISSAIHRRAKIRWNYYQLNQPLQPADAILVLCSYAKRVAEWGAQRWLEGWAPLLSYSGGLKPVTTYFVRDSFATVLKRFQTSGKIGFGNGFRPEIHHTKGGGFPPNPYDH